MSLIRLMSLIIMIVCVIPANAGIQSKISFDFIV